MLNKDVSVGISGIDFLAPAKMGDIIIFKSSVNYTSRSSMEVGVKIESENPLTGKIKHTASAHLTFVALNKNNKPTAVDPITPESKDEIRRYDRGKERYLIRKKRLRDLDK